MFLINEISKLLTNSKILLLFVILIAFSSLNSKEKQSRWQVIRNCEEINTNADEFAPILDIYRNIFYFNSDISGYSMFYQTKIIDSLHFDSPKLTKGDLNQANNNQCCLSILSENEAYYQNYRKTKSYPVINIYKLGYAKNSWANPYIVDSLKSDFYSAFPAVSSDGKILVFSSTRNSDNNDIDLYISYKLNDGSWSIPVSIDELNSPGNEITPFILGSDTLYFSSDGQEGTGKYDIYYSIRNGTQWQRPLPLTSLNTEFDETDFKIINNNIAVFCSDRVGGKGKADIYLAQREEIEKTVIAESDLEISLQAQTLTLQVEKIFEYNIYPLIFAFNSKDFDLLSMKNKPEILDLNIIDSVYMISFDRIFDRIKTKNSSLKISSDINPKIKNYLSNNNIDQKNIEFVNISENKIYIETTNDEIASIIELGKTEFLVSPPALDIVVDARPKEIVSEIDISLQIDSKIHKIKEHKAELPLQFFGKTTSFGDQLFNASKVSIFANAKTNSGVVENHELSFNVIKEERRERNFKTINKAKFEQFYAITDLYLFSQKSNFGSVLKAISESAIYSKNVYIDYYSEIGKSKAEFMKNELLKLKIVNVKIRAAGLPLNLRFADVNSILSIMVEKY